MENFYITTTLPYVNADPHIGFALEIIQADAIARMKRLQGYNVCFNTGTDEHGLKIFRKSQEEKKEIQIYCDEYADKFKSLKQILNISYTNFIRTTDSEHIKAAQEFWRKCRDNGDIYKKKYRTKYCVGCELEKTDSELENEKCPLHPLLKIEIIEEENYFFRFGNYQQKLMNLYKTNPDFVVPKTRANEISQFIESGLQDFSISRLKRKMPWGIEVPDDRDHVMYVWFDALINYISTLGWPENEENFNAFWPGVQIAGKDNLRQQCAIWQAMLMSANLPVSKQIFIHGFITSQGKKMSKSSGNVVDPLILVKKYGIDAVRYYLLREIPSLGDGDFSEKRFVQLYNADLANGLGNLISRAAKLCQDLSFSVYETNRTKFSQKVSDNLKIYNFDRALSYVWQRISELDKYINKKEPWKISDERALYKILYPVVEAIRQIGFDLQPFMPETAQKILKQFSQETITMEEPYFRRIL